ncbi:MAG: EAL domain-containing protein [Candidatus Korobacteraceae bacterium]|jgi:PAS domain S-box-containing protein
MAINSRQDDIDRNGRKSSRVSKKLPTESEERSAENQQIQTHAEQTAAVNAKPADLSAQVEGYLRTLLDTVPAGIFVVDAETRCILDINRHALQLIGKPKAKIVGSICHKTVCPADGNACPVLDLGQSVDQSERVLLTAGGGQVPILKSVTPAIRDGRKVLVETFVNINSIKEAEAEASRATEELKEAKKAAETAALQDPLTKLPNRRLFYNRLNLSLQRVERHKTYLCAVLYLDLDDFNIVNDSLGHDVGDELLMEVANRLEACLRRTDLVSRFPGGEDLVVRLGGDEFAILLDDIREPIDALRVADRIAERLQQPFHLRGMELLVTACMGITTSDRRYASPEDMLRDADTAMNRAKADGRGKRVVFDETMHRWAVARLHLESELRQAVERREFVLYYQPIVSLRDKRIVSFEALLRWRSPQRGLVQPNVFISVAEQIGLIIPIGTWVLKQACIQLCRWQEHLSYEPPLSVSVNVSAKQFAEPEFVNIVKRTLQETGVEARNLCLELTESVAMEEPDRTSNMLKELQHLGVRLSIDDFGTGFSSLDHLHRLSFDTLKIDRRFVAGMVEDQRNQKIVNTIIGLGHTLQMKIVAEGAETVEQLTLLDAMACDCVQGYIFSRPLEPAELEGWMSGCLSTASLHTQRLLGPNKEVTATTGGNKAEIGSA